ncbi:MAG: hypothetical protein AUI10_05650 [Actinobacteria bacterium 13_2_20CM_2_72_6]|nr:MAG: hypothetical protein AUI10_05650 [Actinobacteria bacterium 13_2_20CM_2_72_6]
MDVVVGFVAVVAVLTAIMAAFGWFATRMKRSGVGGGIMGPIDEVYRPTARESRIEIQVQEERGIRDLSGRDPRP